MSCIFCGAESRSERCPRCRDELRREFFVALVVGIALGTVIAISFFAAWLQ